MSAQYTSRARLFFSTLTFCLGLAAIVVPSEATARQAITVDYNFEQVWGAAVRLLRVDYGYQLVDRDRDIGFVMFAYQESGRSHNGSVELVPTVVGGREVVRVVVNIPSMPNYIERMLVDRLRRKLRNDFGHPIVRRVAPEAPPADEADAVDSPTSPTEGGTRPEDAADGAEDVADGEG